MVFGEIVTVWSTQLANLHTRKDVIGLYVLGFEMIADFAGWIGFVYADEHRELLTRR